MKRDWDLIKEILLAVEAMESTHGKLPPGIAGYDSATISYHVHLLMQAGLITGCCAGGSNGPLVCWALLLTWEGHEFLDTVRPRGLWEKIIRAARERGLELSYGVIKALAGSVISGGM
jgi:hypothetical protein